MKDLILSEIRKIAALNDGEPPGVTVFQRETGIPPHKWLGVYWARWSDALADAGFQPNEWQERLDSDQLLKRIAEIIKSLGRMPSNAELLLQRRTDTSVPNPRTLRIHFNGRDGLLEALRNLAASDPNFSYLTDTLPTPRARTKPAIATATDGYVYLIKWGEHYKVGRSDDPGRALKEIRAQLPTSASIIHTIQTDDPVGIEAYWHRRFAQQRLRGEWFDLTAADLRAFQRRKFQ